MLRTTLVIAVAVLATAPLATAAQCSVPSGPYPTIQAAIDTPACTEITLASGLFEESPVIDHNLSLTGASSATTTIGGQVEVDGAAVALADLTIAGGGSFTEALWAHSGAEVSAIDVAVIAGGVPAIFSDGFESGDLSRWTSP
jgi:hypothetical protein